MSPEETDLVETFPPTKHILKEKRTLEELTLQKGGVAKNSPLRIRLLFWVICSSHDRSEIPENIVMASLDSSYRKASNGPQISPFSLREDPRMPPNICQGYR